MSKKLVLKWSGEITIKKKDPEINTHKVFETHLVFI